MEIKSIYARAARGVRDDLRLYLVAISSLTVAFLCLATALLGVANLGQLADRWGRTHRLSVYVRDGAAEADVQRLTQALTEVPRVALVTYASADEARVRFLDGVTDQSALRGLPSAAFPASIEVTFDAAASDAEIGEVARKVALQRSVVDDVDTYQAWFQQIGGLLGAGRALALGLGLLVVLCVVAVVANTIRLAVANRRDEIEVLKMCGATDAFVRAPFVLEGTMQGLAAALLALAVLLAAYLGLRTQIDGALSTFAGVQLVFLSPAMAAGLLAGGALVGALGSMLSVRRYVAV
ncbi:MAG: permease-like cell division protein FtsX [Polyangiales bacterium]